MSIIPIDYQDIYYYSQLNGLDFLPFEVNTMVAMSRDYVNESFNKNPNAQPPYKEN